MTEDPDELVSLVPPSSILTGYSRGGFQLREAGER